jgi:hypothetical protein
MTVSYYVCTYVPLRLSESLSPLIPVVKESTNQVLSKNEAVVVELSELPFRVLDNHFQSCSLAD